MLAYVTPPLQAIDVSDMRQRQGELDQQISIVERRLARYESLAPSGAVARSQLDDTRLELEGLKDRRASLDKVRREPEALVAPSMASLRTAHLSPARSHKPTPSYFTSSIRRDFGWRR